MWHEGIHPTCSYCRKMLTCELRGAIADEMDIVLDDKGNHDMMFSLVRIMLFLTDGVCPQFEKVNP